MITNRQRTRYTLIFCFGATTIIVGLSDGVKPSTFRSRESHQKSIGCVAKIWLRIHVPPLVPRLQERPYSVDVDRNVRLLVTGA